MLTMVKDRILQIHKAHGLEISIIGNGEWMIRSVTLKREKNKVIKEKQSHGISSLADLPKKASPGIPVAVAINGKGILHKKALPDIDKGGLFEAILPNSNPNEFYLDISGQQGFLYASIIRKELLDKILSELTELGYKVLSVSLGIAPLQYLLPFLNTERQGSIMTSSCFLISLNQEKRIIDVSVIPRRQEDVHPEVEYSIGDQYVNAGGLLAFGTAMSLIVEGASVLSGIDNGYIDKAREEYRYFKFYKTALWTLLSGIFCLLLVNFFVYNYFFDKNTARQASLGLTREEEKRMEKLATSIQQKEKFISQYGWDRHSRISLYADRIAALMPGSATLTDLKINPLNTGSFLEASVLSFKEDTIQITGICEDPTELNRFVNNLRNIRDFQKVNIKSYLYKKETQNGIFFMEIITI
jgi:Tfp pilus assembly protein PilN